MTSESPRDALYRVLREYQDGKGCVSPLRVGALDGRLSAVFVEIETVLSHLIEQRDEALRAIGRRKNTRPGAERGAT